MDNRILDIFRRSGQVLFALALGVAILTAAPTASAQDRTPPRVENGILDLQNWDFHRDGAVALDGWWAFYWDRFLRPRQSGDLQWIPPASYIRVPFVWNGHWIGSGKATGFGYASYRMRILLPPKPSPLAMHIIDVATACRIYVNGRPIYRAGQPGTTLASTRPSFRPGVVELGLQAGAVDLLVHIANFHHRQGGLWDRIAIGTPQQMHRMRERRIVFNMVLFGALLLMGLYHLGIYGLRRDDPTALYFGLGCLAVLLRTLTTGERYLVQFFPGFPFEWLSKLEYWGFYLAVGCFALFAHALFPRESDRRIILGIAVLSGLFSLLVLLTPLRVYSYSTPVFEAITLLALGYGVAILGRAVANKRSGAGLFMAAFLVLSATALNDILYSRQVIHSFYMVQFGLLVFILAQAFVLSRRSSDLFDTVADQQVQLGASEEKYRLLVENSNEAIFIIQDGVFKFANPRTEILFGFGAEELTSLPFISCVHAEDRGPVKNHLNRAMTTGRGVVSETFRLVKRTGRTIWVQLNAVATTWENRPAVLHFLSDVSERKQLEAQLYQTQKMEALETLAIGLAQDVGRHLAHVVRNVERVRAGQAPESGARARLRSVLDACADARRRVDQVLIFGLQGPRDLRPLRIAPEIETVVLALGQEIVPNIRIHTDIAAHKAVVLADDGQIRDVLVNLVTNAADAMKEGEGTLYISLHEVTVAPGSLQHAGRLRPGNYVRLSVADTGVGIPEEIQDRIFDPYFTTKASGARAGMGLAAVMGIVKSHKGEIGLVSAPNMGTTFHVYLPTTSLGGGAEKAA